MLETRTFSDYSVDTCSVYPWFLSSYLLAKITPKMNTINKHKHNLWSYFCNAFRKIKVSKGRLNKYRIFSNFIHNMPKLETTQMSSNGWMVVNKMWYTHSIESSMQLKRNKLLIFKLLTFKIIRLSVRKQTHINTVSFHLYQVLENAS